MLIQSSQFILNWFKRKVINKDDACEVIFLLSVLKKGVYNSLNALKRNPHCKHCHVFVQNVNSVF